MSLGNPRSPGRQREADEHPDALRRAWHSVHVNTPAGWYVGTPGYEERYRRWSMYAFDPSEKPVVGKRSREWTAVGQTELHCVCRR